MSGEETREAVAAARERVYGARRGVVLTGAGISADSGVPTFRGEDGLWREHRPEELATPRAFARDPVKVWQWYAWRRRKVAACAPNAAHLAIARWCRSREEIRLVTQNVDGLHTDALREVDGGRKNGAEETAATPPGSGAEADDPVPLPPWPLELHGSLFRTRCTGCGRTREDRRDLDPESRDALPRCSGCGDLLRPDVVWFGESLDRRVLDAAFAAARRAQVCLVVGTSATVQPAASVATAAAEAGAALVEVNPEESALTPAADVSLRARAADAVPRILPGSK